MSSRTSVAQVWWPNASARMGFVMADTVAHRVSNSVINRETCDGGHDHAGVRAACRRLARRRDDPDRPASDDHCRGRDRAARGRGIILRSTSEPAEVPGQPLDHRRCARRRAAADALLRCPRRQAAVPDDDRRSSTWTIWRAPDEDWNGPDGPGFNQRFIGELSADGTTIDGRWERGMGDAGDAVGARLSNPVHARLTGSALSRAVRPTVRARPAPRAAARSTTSRDAPGRHAARAATPRATSYRRGTWRCRVPTRSRRCRRCGPS